MTKNKLLIAVAFVIITLPALAQENLKFENTYFCDTILYTWKPGLEINGEVMKRFFPSYYTFLPHKDTVLKAVLFQENNILKKAETMFGVNILSNILLYQKNRDTILKSVLKGELTLQIELFSNNLDSMDVWYELKELNKWFKADKIELIKSQNYQPLITISIELDSLVLKNKDISTLTLSRIKIFGIKTKNQKPALFFGGIVLKDNYILKNVVDHNSTSVYQLNWKAKDLKEPSVCLELPNYNEHDGQRPKMKLLINDALSESEKVNYVSAYFHQILINYPYYSVKSINKDSILNMHLQIVKKAKNLNSYYLQFAKLMASCSDIHFHVVNLKKKETNFISKPPLYFGLIKGEVQVIGIFDTTLCNKVSLGDRLIKINHKPIEFIYNEIKFDVSASNEQGYRKKITQQLLALSFNYFHDNLELEFTNPKHFSIVLDSISIFKNKNILIPVNFKGTSGLAYSKIHDFSYLRIGEFIEDSFNPFIYSYFDSIELSKGVIFDVRNNGAGDLSFATLSSFFIKNNTPFLQIPNINPFNHSNEYYTKFVKPSFNYCQKPVVFLVDARSTCAVELLISNLKKLKQDVWVIGETTTAGAAQLACTINLPETIDFAGYIKFYNTPSLNGFNESIDENGGIKPDIWVSFDSYKDFAPYNDKLLKTAILFLENYSKCQNQKK